MQIYSEKQRHLLRLWQNDQLKRINILEGSVRSGKTWVSLVLWAFWVATMPEDKAYIMVAKTLTSLRRNVLDLLQTLVGSNNFSYSLARKEARLFGRLVYLEGVNDSRAESKIRGMTLQGAYCDELTLFTEDFFTMLLSRLSEHGAKVFSTTNPDSPAHWVKVNYLDRADDLDLFSIKFTLNDNPFLDPDYIENLRKEYTGVYFDRFIRGMWQPAQGIIYRQFADNPDDFIIDSKKLPSFVDVRIGVDFGGNKSASCFMATGFTQKYQQVITFAEEYRPAATENPDSLNRAFVEFCKKIKKRYPNAFYVYADSAEQILIRGLRLALQDAGIAMQINNALKQPITDRIRLFNALMAKGRYKITPECKELKKSLSVAVWDDRKLEDTRLDDGSYNVDCLDGVEYSVEPVANWLQVLGYSKKLPRAINQKL